MASQEPPVPAANAAGPTATESGDGHGDSKKKPGLTIDMKDLDLGLDDPERKDADDKKKWLPRGRVRAFRAALLLFVAEGAVPPTQRWLIFTLLLFFQQDFEDPLYLWLSPVIVAMWWYTWLPPTAMYGIFMAADRFLRTKHLAFQIYNRSIMGVAEYTLFCSILRATISLEGLTQFLESLFGPAAFWPYALVPMLPGLFFIDDRESINGFVPEGRQGILLAIFCHACNAVLPLSIQWVLWFPLSFPDPRFPIMVMEWFFCAIVWFYFGVPPLAAYALHLLLNQYPHPSAWLRRRGGGPSVILQRERRGTLWFIATALILRALETRLGHEIEKIGDLILLAHVWFPVLLILVFGIFLLKYGLALRAGKFQYKPIKGRNGFRLLRLRAQPCFANSPIQCDLIHTSPKYPPSYTAVSYRWESPKEIQEIILIDGAPFLVSPNLHAFLLAKRRPYFAVCLWVDSICINQADKVEKSRQVVMMRNIFEEATTTVGWLGEDPGAKKALSLVNKILENRSINNFARLRKEEDVGWAELKKLLSNEWFERVWIIQEIAVSVNPVLRYGTDEIEWRAFAAALITIMVNSFGSEVDELWQNHHLLNALIMENIRLHVEEVDYLKLKDLLKVASRFKSTLPVDKVYALLGIVEERSNPLFHPRLTRTGSLDTEIARPGHLFKEALSNLIALHDLLGSLSGSSNTRKGRAILSSKTALRHMAALVGNTKKLFTKIRQLNDGTAELECELIQPDYSEKSTPEMIYTYVARDLVRQGDIGSFIRHAGIGTKRKTDLEALPSWVPDWSADLDSYVLPVNNELPSKSKESSEAGNVRDSKGTSDEKNVYSSSGPQSEKAKAKEENGNQTCRLGGPEILLIKGFEIGEIAYVSDLTESLQNFNPFIFEEALKYCRRTWVTNSTKSSQDGESDNSEDGTKSLRNRQFNQILKQARKDFTKMRSNYLNARNLAFGHCRSKYPTEDAIRDAFLRTIAVDSSHCSSQPAQEKYLTSLENWISGYMSDCVIWPALWPEQATDYWNALEPTSKQEKRDMRDLMCKKYLFIRNLHSSSNTKLAHLVRTEIVPSFAKYRWAEQSKGLFKPKGKSDPKVARAQNHDGDAGATSSQKQGKGSTKQDEEEPKSLTFSIFDNVDGGPLFGYRAFVDYTIGRRFAIMESGRMGLVPGGAKVGDVVVYMPSEKLCLAIRPQIQPKEQGVMEEDENEERPATEGSKDAASTNSDTQGNFRLVGEAYIQDLKMAVSDKDKKDDAAWEEVKKEDSGDQAPEVGLDSDVCGSKRGSEAKKEDGGEQWFALW